MRAIGKFVLLFFVLLSIPAGVVFAAGTAEISTVVESSETSAINQSSVFTATDIKGNKVSSDIFSGSKLTMLNVWATYCNPCLSEMPGLGELANEFDPSTFQLIGVVSDVPEGVDAKVVKALNDLVSIVGANYTHLLLNESLYNAFLSNVVAVPTTFFFDSNGNIVDTVVGSMSKSAWRSKIDGLLENI